MKTVSTKSLFRKTALIVLFGISLVTAQEWERISYLKGYWKFSIGDDAEWAQPGFDDKSWDEIFVPSPWENQGFNGYNGYAWYRTKVLIPSSAAGSGLLLKLGYIDDVDEVYFNGKKIGKTGEFPPDFVTAYDQFRNYNIPSAYVNYGKENYLAVRVYDIQIEGGIVSGEVSIFGRRNMLRVNQNLEGEWKFILGDSPRFRSRDYDDSKWRDIIVPANWESEGYDYDGVAWYRKEFVLSSELKNKNLVLAVGKIDDIDEVYLNGKLIGKTGTIKDFPNESDLSDHWQSFRGYYINKSDLNQNGSNVIAVRVYDGYINGGIYDGPVGLVTQERYTKYWQSVKANEKKTSKSFWDLIFR